MNPDLLYQVALTLIPKVGPKNARKMVAYVGSVEGIFKESKNALSKIPGIGDAIINKINSGTLLKQAEQDISYLKKNEYKALFYLDKEYPLRLKECEDAPTILYYKGNYCFNQNKIVSIVGTRSATNYGVSNCEQLIEKLAENSPDLVIASGMAYGIDICAHKAAIKNNLRTLGILGNGLEYLYPSLHRKYIKPVLETGAFVTEFPTRSKPEPGNFVSRNRIIAGLADATIVVESAAKGGALITADMANSYNRDVFAFPGRSSDKYSVGCNNLIKNNQAALISCADDLIKYMQWDISSKQKPVQQSLFLELSTEEQQLMDVLKTEALALDEISRQLNIPVSKLSAMLLNLEFKGLVKALPGKMFAKI